MKHRINLVRIGVCIFATLLTLSCNTSEARPQPSVEPYVPQVTDVSPTNTPLPPLPDFDQVISYGGGGGGEPGCMIDPGYRPALTIEDDGRIIHKNYVDLCLWGDVKSHLPFQLQLVSPDGRTFLSNELIVDQNSLYWEGYEGFDEYFNPMLYDGSIQISWPVNYPSGQWHVIVTGEGFQADANFFAPEQDQPSIFALDSRSENEIIPFVPYSLGFHPVRLLDSGSVKIIGMNFPANMPVYILLYRETVSRSTQEATLIYKESVHSDSNGLITTELFGPFEPDQFYLVYGISDSNDSDARYNAGDYFRIAFSTVASEFSSNSNSCPGAPPQRMIINQRGHVCTLSDPVSVRASPARSANTLVQIESGTQFTVIGGPSCSDNWSWWNIQLLDGTTTGWVSEGGDAVDPYFICPMP